MTRARYSLILVAIFTLGALHAAEGEADPWRLTLDVHLWMADVDGSLEHNGAHLDFGVDFDDIVDELDFAYMGSAELAYERWFAMADLSLMEIESQAEGDFVELDLEYDLTILDLVAGYSFWTSDRRHPENPDRSLGQGDVFAGLRYWHTDSTLTSTGPFATREASSDDDILDPLIGVRGETALGNRWSIAGRFDLGGFGIGGDASDLTWQIYGLIGLRCWRSLYLYGGYRGLGREDETDGTEVDLLLSGPILGLSFDAF